MISSLKDGYNLGYAMLDSGAFSVLTGIWKKLPIDAYIDFVSKHYDKFLVIAAPDIIGSTVKTFENTKYFVTRLEELNIWNKIAPKVAITYHLIDRDFDNLRRMVEWSIEKKIGWFALGGIANTGLPLDRKWVSIERVQKIVFDEMKAPFKYHLFGCWLGDFIREIKPNSVDSSTYIASAKSLSTLYYNSNWKDRKDILNKKSDSEQLATIFRRFNQLAYVLPTELQLQEKEFLEMMKSIPGAVRLWMLNSLAVKEFEFRVQQKIDPNFRFWVSVHFHMVFAVMGHSPTFAKIALECWKDRILSSFQSLAQSDDMPVIGVVARKFLDMLGDKKDDGINEGARVENSMEEHDQILWC